MSDLEGLKADLGLVKPEVCDDCVAQCTDLSAANSEGFLCLRAVAEGRNGETRRIGDLDLRKLIMEPPVKIRVHSDALQFIFDDFDQRYPNDWTQA